jgi:hypothetical protein
MVKKVTKKRLRQRRKFDYVLCKCTICKRDKNGYRFVSKSTRTRHRTKERKFALSPESLDGNPHDLEEEDKDLNNVEEENRSLEEETVEAFFADNTDSNHPEAMARETIISEENDTQALFELMLSDTDSSQSEFEGKEFKHFYKFVFLI